MDFSLLKSIRFWQVVLGVVVQTIAIYLPSIKPVADAISMVCGVSVVIGTVDKTVTTFTK